MNAREQKLIKAGEVFLSEFAEPAPEQRYVVVDLEAEEIGAKDIYVVSFSVAEYAHTRDTTKLGFGSQRSAQDLANKAYEMYGWYCVVRPWPEQDKQYFVRSMLTAVAGGWLVYWGVTKFGTGFTYSRENYRPMTYKTALECLRHADDSVETQSAEICLWPEPEWCVKLDDGSYVDPGGGSYVTGNGISYSCASRPVAMSRDLADKITRYSHYDSEMTLLPYPPEPEQKLWCVQVPFTGRVGYANAECGIEDNPVPLTKDQADKAKQEWHDVKILPYPSPVAVKWAVRDGSGDWWSGRAGQTRCTKTPVFMSKKGVEGVLEWASRFPPYTVVGFDAAGNEVDRDAV